MFPNPTPEEMGFKHTHEMKLKDDEDDLDNFLMLVTLDNDTILHYEFEDVHSLGALQKFVGSFLCSENHQPNVQIKNIQIFSPKSASELRRLKMQIVDRTLKGATEEYHKGKEK